MAGKTPKEIYPPDRSCALLSPRPSGSGYVCSALSELLCATRGSCKFVKHKEQLEKDRRG